MNYLTFDPHNIEGLIVTQLFRGTRITIKYFIFNGDVDPDDIAELNMKYTDFIFYGYKNTNKRSIYDRPYTGIMSAICNLDKYSDENSVMLFEEPSTYDDIDGFICSNRLLIEDKSGKFFVNHIYNNIEKSNLETYYKIIGGEDNESNQKRISVPERRGYKRSI